jgi:hypothetical protein
METDQRQPNRQKDNRHSGQENHAGDIIVVVPKQLFGESVPAFRLVPTGVVGWQPDVGQGQDKEGAEAVDQGRMFQAEAGVACSQEGQAASQVILLVHRRAVVYQAADGQEEEEQDGRNGQPLSMGGLLERPETIGEHHSN